MARALCVAGYAGLLLAWTFATPAGSAPDERTHFLRAASLGHGQLLGAPLTVNPRDPRPARLIEWEQITTRFVTIPANLRPPAFGECFEQHPDRSAACSRSEPVPLPEQVVTASYAATYPPLSYLLPGLAMQVAPDPFAGFFTGRAVAAAFAGGLLLAALLVIPASFAELYMGLAVAASPGLLFLAASLNPSGLETAAAAALAVSLSALVLGPGRRGAVVALGCVSAAVLMLTRPVGPAWVAIELVVFAALAAFAGARVRSTVRLFAPVLATSGAALVAAVAWDLATRAPGEAAAFDWTYIGQAVAAIPEQLREQVGVFGWLDAPMPAWTYWAWAAPAVALVGFAVALGRRCGALAVAVAVAGALLAVVLVPAVLLMPYGWVGQGRYSQPATVVVPILAAAVVSARGRRRLPPGLWAAVGVTGAGVVGAVQLVGWYADGRRYAVSLNGPWLFAGHADWQPPLGWPFWIAVAAVASAALAGGLVLTLFRSNALDEGRSTS